MSADLILTGAVVRTANRARPVAEAIAFAGGTVLAVGTADDVLAHRGDDTEVRNLAGAAVYPGFVDVHNHHAVAGVTDLFELSFGVALSLDEILELVRERAATLPEDAWITGGSWASTLMDEVNTTAARLRLDEAAGGRPVMLSDDSHHNRWVNTRALRLAGITKEAIPAEGVTLVDAADGEPSGVLLEAAGILVAKAHAEAGGLTADQHRRASARGIELLNGYGVTTFQDAAVSLDILRALTSLDDAGELNAWVVSSLTVNDEIFGYELVGHELIARGEEFRSEHHRPDFVKIFLDGVPPARTALFLDPYLPDDVHGAHFHGTTTMDADELYGWLHAVADRGLGAKVHVTGDGSARVLIDVVERLRSEGYTDTRFQMAHGQFLAGDDIERMVRLGIAADISPFLWFPGVIPDALASVLGDRAYRSQPNRTILDAGGLVAGGSDWPVSESPNPFEGMQGLVTRADPLGRAPGVLWPEQAITAGEALEVFTINGARAMGLEDVTGSLEPGKSADFVIVDRDFVTGPADAIIDTRVLETWFAGRRVFTAG
ncbi:amidohydrolase [Microbacterium rhizosphaerae]|uniref:Amidohydrolase n=1 Tax=Microbacterium rhizosphaerae TaxID=1678237 RepID=A0ABZ0SR07_9MICO|nr:amidohydrolase [Microbacterium rhizosphaerae]WPR90726.1 amidohydrolase [Microbacterium rhizosphaerae]